MNQTFFTAAELAEIAKAGGLMNFPHTKRRVNSFIEREGWDALPSTRKRAGTKGGGGMEYHFQVLPEALQALIAGSQVKAGLIARHDLEAERDRRQVAAIRTSALPAEARAVTDARAEVLVSIDGYAIAQGQTRAWAITQFAEALAAYAERQKIERRRDAGEILTPREAASLARPLILTSPDGFQIDPSRVKIANDRARAAEAISERSIQRWFKARDERGVIALAPAATKEVQPIPAAFADFLKFYARPSKPTIAYAHGEYLKAAAAVDVLQRMPLTLAQVKYILRERMNNIEKQVGREGLLTLRSRLAYVTRTTDDMWPTTIYTADGKTFDAEVADPVTKRPIRPEITTVLDVVTRKVVGISLARSENQRSVAEALRNACVASGMALMWNDPWWDVHFPPNDWKCSCGVRTLSRGDLKRLGKDGPDTAPEIVRKPRLLNNGETVMLPDGVGYGWDYMPGDLWERGLVPSALIEEGGQLIHEGRHVVRIDDPEPLLDLLVKAKPFSAAANDRVQELDILAEPTAEQLVTPFLHAFGASLGQAVLHTDKTGVKIPISDQMFRDRSGAWKIGKRTRGILTPYLAEAIIDPDEIWIGVTAKPDPVTGDVTEYLVDRRYIRADPATGLIVVFEMGRLWWDQITAYNTTTKGGKKPDLDLLNRRRGGKLLWKRK